VPPRSPVVIQTVPSGAGTTRLPKWIGTREGGDCSKISVTSVRLAVLGQGRADDGGGARIMPSGLAKLR
jgi:hypothetical protein